MGAQTLMLKTFNRTFPTIKLTLLILIGSIALTASIAPAASAQLFVRPQSRDDEPDDTESGASLKTDPDLEAHLAKAERYRSDGNFRTATKLWQAVLRQSGDSLYTRDRETYFSLVE